MANLREDEVKVDRFFWSDQKKSCYSGASLHWSGGRALLKTAKAESSGKICTYMLIVT